MRKTNLTPCIVAGIALLLAGGLVRGATNRYEQRRKAILAQCEAEQKRLGLKDKQAAFAKYPTPEIELCRMVRILPGATGDVIVQGKFPPGTKFLFENDSVEVVKEAATASEYRATVRVAAGGGPSYANLHAFAPVSGGNNGCTILYIGGRYEWEFRAQNGWRIKLGLVDERFRAESGNTPEATYRAEFFRGAETKPFEVRNFRLSLSNVPWDDSYSGSIEEEQSPVMAEYLRLTEKMQDPKLTAREMESLTRQFEEVSQKVVREQEALSEKMSRPGYMEELERKKQEFGCENISFRVRPSGIEGEMYCGQKVGALELKGTMKFLGP